MAVRWLINWGHPHAIWLEAMVLVSDVCPYQIVVAGCSLSRVPITELGLLGAKWYAVGSKWLCLLTQYWKAAAHKNTLPQGVTTYTSEDSCEIGQLWGEGPSRVIALKSLHFTWNLFALGTRAILNFNWWWTVWLGVSLCLWVSSELRQIIRVLDPCWEDW